MRRKLGIISTLLFLVSLAAYIMMLSDNDAFLFAGVVIAVLEIGICHALRKRNIQKDRIHWQWIDSFSGHNYTIYSYYIFLEHTLNTIGEEDTILTSSVP